MEYYFGEHLRWNLGWDTPNQGGAFVATLLPWLWAALAWFWGRLARAQNLRGRLVWSAAAGMCFGVEVVGTYALARTYSRGALVGLLCGALVWAALALFCGWWRRRAGRGERSAEPGNPAEPTKRVALVFAGLPWLARILLVALCLGLTNFHARIAPDHIAEDRSSTNRLVLWRGGAELVAASPWQGWGWGQSGASFMHWTQPLDRSEGYLSMVNSYLTVAVEGGLPVFALLLAVMLLPLARAFALSVQSKPTAGTAVATGANVAPAVSAGSSVSRFEPIPWLLAASAAWAAWLGCLFFSNLWIIRGLWIAPVLAAVALLGVGPHQGRLWRAGGFLAFGIALVASGGLWLTGSVLSAGQPVVLTRHPDGQIELSLCTGAKRGDAGGGAVQAWVLPDTAVLGESYGQELRRWLLADGRLASVRVLNAVDQIEAPTANVVLLVCGAFASEVAQRESRVPVWLLHPTVEPPEQRGAWKAGGGIVLPGIDLGGKTAGWWSWASQADPAVEVRLNPGLAYDVRPRWPELGSELEFYPPTK